MKPTECGLLIKQISDQIAKSANNALRTDNLTLSQLRCMEYIYDSAKAKVPLKELELHFHISQPTLAGIIARLIQKGLVMTEVNEVNPRAKNALLTVAGKALVQRSMERRDSMENALLAPLSEEEKQVFYEMLNKVNNGQKEV